MIKTAPNMEFGRTNLIASDQRRAVRPHDDGRRAAGSMVES